MPFETVNTEENTQPQSITLDPLQVELALTSNGNRVTPEQIEATIANEHYFTAFDGEVGSFVNAGVDPAVMTSRDQLKLLTFCVLVMKNGYTVVGTSACADPANFKAKIGQVIARQDALEKCWPLLGYELKTRLQSNTRLSDAFPPKD